MKFIVYSNGDDDDGEDCFLQILMVKKTFKLPKLESIFFIIKRNLKKEKIFSKDQIIVTCADHRSN